MVLRIFDCAPCMIAVLDLLHPANEIILLTFGSNRTSLFRKYSYISGVPRNFFRKGGGSTNSVEDRENGDLGAVTP